MKIAYYYISFKQIHKLNRKFIYKRMVSEPITISPRGIGLVCPLTCCLADLTSGIVLRPGPEGEATRLHVVLYVRSQLFQ